jgi:hypothetical protein
MVMRIFWNEEPTGASVPILTVVAAESGDTREVHHRTSAMQIRREMADGMEIG